MGRAPFFAIVGVILSYKRKSYKRCKKPSSRADVEGFSGFYSVAGAAGASGIVGAGAAGASGAGALGATLAAA